jgi:hypothetical protein
MYKEFFEEQTGEPFPQEPEKQLWEAVHAASHTWDLGCSETRGVTVQSTVFGNHDFRSAVGVTYMSSSFAEACDDEDDDCFALPIRGEWLTNAMFEDMQSSDRELLQLSEDASRDWAADKDIPESRRQQEYLSLEEEMPSVFAHLLRCQDIVENHFADVQGFDFAIGEGRLWILQSRACGEQKDFRARQLEVPSEADDVAQASDAVATDAVTPDLATEEELIALKAEASEVQYAEDVVEDAETQLDSGSAASDMQSQMEEDSADCCMHEEESQEAEGLPDGVQCRSLRHGSIRLGLLGTRFWQRRRGLRKRNAGPADSNRADDESTAQQLGKSGDGMLVLPCWQTGLAGGTAAFACRAVATTLQEVKPASFNFFRKPTSCQGFRNLMAAGVMSSSARVFQTGAMCCTLYTNLCSMTPAEDNQNRFSPLWRLGCAGFAAATAHTVSHATAALQITSAGVLPMAKIGRVSPMLAAVVPTMAMEMCAIDLVRNAAVDRGHEVTPGLLFASGAAAGVATQMLLQPMQILKNQTSRLRLAGTCPTADMSQIRPSRECVSQFCKTVGSACLRSSPVVATNSLVRVGLVTYFMSLK